MTQIQKNKNKKIKEIKSFAGNEIKNKNKERKMPNVRIDLMPESLRLETLTESEEHRAKQTWKKLLFNICYSIAPKYWNRLWKEKELLTQAMVDGSIDAHRIKHDRDWSEWNEYSIKQIRVIREYLYNQVLANANIDEVVEFVNEYVDPHISKEQLVEDAKRNYQNYQESLKNQNVTQYYDNYGKNSYEGLEDDYFESKIDEITEGLLKDYPQLKEVITEESDLIKDYDEQLADPKYTNTKATIIGTNGEQIPCWLQLNQQTKERIVSVKYKGQFIQRRPSEFIVSRSDEGMLLIAKPKN